MHINTYRDERVHITKCTLELNDKFLKKTPKTNYNIVAECIKYNNRILFVNYNL